MENDIKEPKKYLEEISEIKSANYGEDHPEALKFKEKLRWLCLECGDWKEADQYLEDILRALLESFSSPFSKDFLRHLITFVRRCLQLEEYKKAEACCVKYISINDKVLGENCFLSIGHVLYLLDEIYSCLGDFKNKELNALKLQRALEIFNQKLPDDDKMISLANLACDIGQFDKAIEYFQLVLKLNPNQIVVKHNLGCCYDLQGKLDLAEKCFVEIRKDQPNSATCCVYGLFLLKTNNHQRAYEEFKASIELKSNNTGLSYSLMEKSCLDEKLQSEIDQHGTIYTEAKYLAYYCIIPLCDQRGTPNARNQYLKEFIDSIEAKPSSFLYRLIGYTYQNLNNPSQAEIYFLKAEKLERERRIKLIEVLYENFSFRTKFHSLDAQPFPLIC